MLDIWMFLSILATACYGIGTRFGQLYINDKKEKHKFWVLTFALAFFFGGFAVPIYYIWVPRYILATSILSGSSFGVISIASDKIEEILKPLWKHFLEYAEEKKGENY